MKTVILYWVGVPTVERLHLMVEGDNVAACGVEVTPRVAYLTAPPDARHRCETCNGVWETENTPLADCIRRALGTPLWKASKEVKIVASVLAFELARTQREVNAITDRLRAITTIFS